MLKQPPSLRLKSYIMDNRIALRNFTSAGEAPHSYALINIVGLALAIACGIVLFAYVESELTYDSSTTLLLMSEFSG